MNNAQQSTQWYEKLVMIRRIEERIADEYRNGVMKTPTHFGIGQEAVAVGVCEALNLDDVVYTHHRSHTHYLAKGGDPIGLIAELYGRVGGCSGGRGGSVHIIDTKVNFWGSSPILGHSLALAAGSALAFSQNDESRVAVAFFGEGACDEGSVWETINFAATRQLPVLFVCENNLYATESPLSVRMPMGTELCKKIEAFGVSAMKVDGNDIFAVHKAAQESVNSIRKGSGPQFLECMTYRWREHVGPMWDYEAGRNYRTVEELNYWMQRCPIKNYENYLLSSGNFSSVDLDILRQNLEMKISDYFNEASKSEWPKAEDLFENVY